VDRRVAQAIERMHTALDSEISVTELARDVNLSASRFAHLFRAEVGQSPRAYLQSLRMQRAGELLDGTFLTIREVMLRVGVNDPSHFARNFRRHHGSSPRRFRTRSRTATCP
jgi:transcriptional regulator GlxA family with amidase domain